MVLCSILLIFFMLSLIAGQASEAEPFSVNEVQIEVRHVIAVTIQETSTSRSARHRDEKVRLMQQLQEDESRGDSKSLRHRVLQALYAFDTYRHEKVERYKALFQSVPPRQRKTLNSVIGYDKSLANLQTLQAANELVCRQIVESGMAYYGISRAELDNHIATERMGRRGADAESVAQALKLFVRDWANEGDFERAATFPCIMSHLERHLMNDTGAGTGSPVEILVPGAGLLRLAYEIASLSPRYAVTANEWSSYVNVAYHFLEDNPKPHSVTIYPFLDIWSHQKTRDEMRRQIAFPDIPVNASQVLLVEGDFTRVLKGRDSKYNAVVTLFFIDTARNLLSYLETINNLLVPGGLWLNFGPLLYGTSPWVQMSLEEIIDVAEAMGFDFLDTDEDCGEITLPGRRVRGKEALYNFNSSSLSKYAYMAQFWVARKRR